MWSKLSRCWLEMSGRAENDEKVTLVDTDEATVLVSTGSGGEAEQQSNGSKATEHPAEAEQQSDKEERRCQVHFGKRARRWVCACTFCCLVVGLLLLYGGLFGLFSPSISFFCRRWSVESETQPGCSSDRWASRARVDSAGHNYTRIVLIGDSMISQPNAEFDYLFRFKAHLAARFPARVFDLVEAGVGLDTIANIGKRLDKDCLAYNPDAVILYWDSDVSEIQRCNDGAVKRAYSEALLSVLRRVASVTTRLAVLGPSVLGELRDGHNLAPWHKDTCLNHYCDLNRDAVQQVRDEGAVQALYVNTRQRFLKREQAFASGAGYVFPSGYLTIDGDHHSLKGSNIIMDVMLSVADQWYS